MEHIDFLLLVLQQRPQLLPSESVVQAESVSLELASITQLETDLLVLSVTSSNGIDRHVDHPLGRYTNSSAERLMTRTLPLALSILHYTHPEWI